MKGRSPGATLAASPTMVGAVTTLILIVAVFLAYNANNGLPFVPVYSVSVDVPNAARLGTNNEVRIGGTRVGVVESIEPVEIEEGGTASTEGDGTAGDVPPLGARLNLKLDKAAEPLPEDSVFRVRYRSTFGLKYLEIVRGTGPDAEEGHVFDGTNDGDAAECDIPTDPASFSEEIPEQATDGCFQEQTEFDAINNTFDNKTRSAARENLVGFGGAFAGRGASLNDAIEGLRPLVENLGPVSRVLADPSTQLERFIASLARTAEIVAPVSDRAGAVLHQRRDRVRRDRARPGSPQGNDLGGAADPGDRDRHAAQATAVPRRVRRALKAPAPGRAGPPRRPAGPEQRDRRRDADPGAYAGDEPRPPRGARGAGRPRRAVLHRALASSASATRSTQPAASPSGSSPRRPSATTGTTGSRSCPRRSPTGTRWATRSARPSRTRPSARYRSTSGPATITVPGETHGPSPATRASRPRASTGPCPTRHDDGMFEPEVQPTVHGNPFGPTGQKDADCQGGQSGYFLGRLPIPGQPASNPSVGVADIPGSRGPTTLYYGENAIQPDGSVLREFRDTRVPSRQP